MDINNKKHITPMQKVWFIVGWSVAAVCIISFAVHLLFMQRFERSQANMRAVLSSEIVQLQHYRDTLRKEGTSSAEVYLDELAKTKT